MAMSHAASGAWVLGLDLGTSAAKAALVAVDGTVRATGRATYLTHSPHPLWTEQDPADWLPAVIAATREALAAGPVPPAAVAAVALTSAAHVGVLLDQHDQPVRPAILWHDQRSAGDVADLEREAGETILRLTCQAVSTTWTLAHLRWVRRHEPTAWARTRSLLLSKDYLAFQLCGRRATDPATALSAQLCDVATGTWSDALCELAGLARTGLPEIVSLDTVLGGLLPEVAAQLGLTAGTPVVTGTLDSATELYAAGLRTPGQALVRLATAGGVQVVVPRPTPDRHRITYPAAVAPHWYCQAGTSACAAAVQWGTELLGGEAGLSFAAWDALAAAAPAGAEGLIFHPYLAGERAPHWDPELRGSFVGLTFRHGRHHLARAIYEGTTFAIRQALTALPGHLGDEPLAVVGGGARSPVWMPILAATLGRPLRPAPDADSALGAALLGWRALGAPESPVATGDALLVPDAAAVATAAERYASYVDIHRRLAPVYHTTRPMN